MSNYSLNSAKALIESGVESNFKYACLELRLAIEGHVYRKLDFHSKRHGKKLLYKNWQPNKAFKILCQLEPRADQSRVIRVAKQTGEEITKLNYIKIGSHYGLPASWISKTYNKLGSYLHLQPLTQSIAQADKDFLLDVLAELEKSEKENLLSNSATTITFECLLCNEEIICCEDALTAIEEVVCPKDQCDGTYTPKKEGEEWLIELKTPQFTCPDCKVITNIDAKELSVGQGICCGECGSKFLITGNEWKFLKVKN